MAEHPRISFTVPSTGGAASVSALGTVLYRGPVPPTSGEWLGVEWDDPSRGKHDGVYEKTGERYFTCRQPGAGSFLRPTAPGLSYGVFMRSALHSKYLDDSSDRLKGSSFYATSSNFEVEVVSLGRVRDRFKQLERLREVGLEWEGVSGAGSAEEAREVAQELASLEVLNLSYSLLPTLEAVDAAIAELPKLRTLTLNSNRFTPLQSSVELDGFRNLTSLNLNRTFVRWEEILLLSPSLPELRELQLGDNYLESISNASAPPHLLLPKLKTLNLDSNKLSDWSDVLAGLERLPSLERLILSANNLKTLARISKVNPTISHLSLTGNSIDSWSSLDALNRQLPALESLWISNNPLFAELEEAAARLEVIARVRDLSELEGSRISPTEREDAEIWYVGKVSKAAAADSEKEREHPRWRELAEKYNLSTAPVEKKATAMKGRLIHLNVSADDSLEVSTTSPPTLAVLPTLRTLLLRTQISRLLGRPLPKAKWKLVAILRSSEEGEEGLRVEIPAAEEGREISWWGLGEGDEVRVEGRN